MKLSDLKKRDVIMSKYGFSEETLIIKANDIERNGIAFTMPDWLKSENAYISYDKLEKNGWIYIKRYSLLKWLLKL